MSANVGSNERGNDFFEVIMNDHEIHVIVFICWSTQACVRHLLHKYSGLFELSLP